MIVLQTVRLHTLDKWGVDVGTYEFVREYARRVLQTL